MRPARVLQLGSGGARRFLFLNAGVSPCSGDHRETPSSRDVFTIVTILSCSSQICSIRDSLSRNPRATMDHSELKLDEEAVGSNAAVGEKKDVETPTTDDYELSPEQMAIEKKLIRKLDINLIPLIMLLYAFSFLDR